MIYYPCANSCKDRNCRNSAMPGHIYCKPCYLDNRGYDRHNPPAPKSA
jgi:hypothetical protein